MSCIELSNPLPTFWSDCIIEELVRLSVKDFCFSSGYRSAEILNALSKRSDVNITSHYDERGAAFFALGMIRRKRKPVAVVCTSGTALANYYPAVVEASKAGLPLVVISADRPEELRNAGARQTIDQSEFFGKFVRGFIDLPVPRLDYSFSLLLQQIDTIVADSLIGGPVHINCQFSEPFADNTTLNIESPNVSYLKKWLNTKEPFTQIPSTERMLPASEVNALTDLVSSSKRGLIVVGETTVEDSEAILKLAVQSGWPVLADITAPIRFMQDTTGKANIISFVDILLRNEELRSKISPDLILHFGGPLTAKFFSKLNAGAYLHVSPVPFRQDEFGLVTKRYFSSIPPFIDVALQRIKFMPSEVLRDCVDADNLTDECLAKELSVTTKLEEWAVVRKVFELASEGQGFFLASSLTVRYADWFTKASDSNFIAVSNRGVNGIDGTLASACGFSSAHQKPMTAILGDLAFLHDLNSLPLARNLRNPFVCIVLNNNGGGIFSLLKPLKKIEDYERFYGTPHNIGSFKNFVQGAELKYFNPASLAEFEECYQESLSSDVATVIEIQSDRTESASRLEQLLKQSY